MAVTSCTKWSCPMCTYNNWPSCSKCVLCGSSKPSEDEVIPRIPVTKYLQQNTGWFKLYSSSSNSQTGVTVVQPPENIMLNLTTPSILSSSASQENPSLTHGHHTGQTVKGTGKCRTKAKWVCSNCTYLNWPNAGQCTLCGVPHIKTKVVRNEPPGLRNEGASHSSSTRPPSHDSILGYASGVGAVGGASAIVNDSHHSSKTKGSRHGNRGGGGGQGGGGGGGIGADNKKKWKCQRCTFENWPKAIKCSMCMGNRVSISPSSGAECPSRNAPPLSPHSLHHTTLHSSPSQVSPRHYHPSASSPVMVAEDLGSMTSEQPNSISDTRVVTSDPDNEIEMGSAGGGCGRDRLILYGSSLSRQMQLKSDTDEVRQIRNTLSSMDWLFLNACLGIVKNEEASVRAYLRHDGPMSRQLIKDECLVLGQPSIFSVGTTIVHLAIRFQRSEMLGLLLTPAPSDAHKRLPSESNQDLACSIREEFSLSLHQHKAGEWSCYYTTQINTFILPAEIRRFCSAVQKRVLDEILDKDVHRELEAEIGIINWSNELVEELSSKLYPLWNRTAGDCLLDSVLQAAWGVVDRDATLRRAMADSLTEGGASFFERWKYSEQRLSQSHGFSLNEDQLQQDWGVMATLADQTGRALEQIHVFTLAHILRRPVIVYGVRVVKNFRGENLGFANFEGVYLPLLWESSFCWKTPIALAYTRGHFSALVSLASGPAPHEGGSHVTYLPLVDNEGRLLCVHFLNEQEVGCEERLLEEYCECYLTHLGTLTAKQEVLSQQQHSLVVSLVDQWLDRFRKMEKRRESAASVSSSADSDH